MPAAMRAPLVTGIAAVTGLLSTAGFFIDGPLAALTMQGGFIPLRLSGDVEGFVVPVWLTPFTATLIHGDLVHLLTNLVMLVICGRAIEPVIGRGGTALLYAVGAVSGAVGQFIADPASPVPMIGASGAISAIVAVYAMLFSRNAVRALGPIPSHVIRALWLALGWTVIQVMIGLASANSAYSIAIAAHIGGFLAGLAMARPLLAWRFRKA